MFKKTTATVLAAFIVSAGLAPAFAQTPSTSPTPAPQSSQDETVRVVSSTVQLDAVVTEKNGRRVTGLTAADFQILDEGAAQTIDYFSAIEGAKAIGGNLTATGASADKPAGAATPAAATPPPSSLTVPYEGRHIALVFDDLNLSNDNFLRSRRAFTDYINNSLTSRDMVALISTGGALASMQQFTNDKQRLLSALNRIAAQTRIGSVGKRQFNMTDTEAIRIDAGDSIALSNVVRRAATTDEGPTGTMADEAAGMSPRGGQKTQGATADEGRVRAYARGIVAEIGAKARSNLGTLDSLFRGMSDLPGRKIVILMTEAFITAGGTSEDITNQLRQVIEVARRGGISVYALDAAGLRTENVGAAEYTTGASMAFRNAYPDLTMGTSEKLGGAIALVSGTGGELIANTNSLISGLERAIQDSSSYYVVGFSPSKLDNKFHRLTVSVRSKPDLVVRTRKGYLAVNSETIRGTEAELVRALKSPVPLLDLPVELVANVVPAVNEQTVVTGLHVGRNYLSLPSSTASDQTAAYEVVAYVFAAGRDKPVGGVVRTLTYNLGTDTQARAKLKAEGFVFVPQPFTGLEPGVYQMRAVIREKTSGAVGSAYQFFEVPDIKDRKTVSMSSVVISPEGQSTFNGANSFKPGVSVDMRFIIYNLPKEVAGLGQRVKLMDAGGTALLDSELAIAQPGATGDRSQAQQGTRFTLPAQRGRYSLLVTLKDAKGKVDLERRTDVVIE